MLDDDMQRVIAEQRLGYVASVCADGTANLSPKGTVAVWDQRHLVFAHIHSHQTVANIEAGHVVVEVNVVDPIRRKGYRFKGPAEVHRDGELYHAGAEFFQRRSGLDERVAALCDWRSWTRTRDFSLSERTAGGPIWRVVPANGWKGRVHPMSVNRLL